MYFWQPPIYNEKFDRLKPLPERISQSCDNLHEQQLDFRNKINCIEIRFEHH